MQSSQPDLSILILTVPNRVSNSFQIIIKTLERQINKWPAGTVELLGLYDNKVMPLGDKRNRLLSISNGRYVTFIDDDDKVDDDYITEILRVIRSARNPDVITFPIISTILGGNRKYCRYGLNLDYTDDGENWTGKPAHTHVWRREIAIKGVFPSCNFGEDTDWVAQVCQYAKTEYEIDKPLYFYDVSIKSETRLVV